MPARRIRAYGEDGNVVHALDMPEDGSPLKFNSEEHIEKIVFYDGDPEEEFVVGSEEVGKSGQITAEFVEPAKD